MRRQERRERSSAVKTRERRCGPGTCTIKACSSVRGEEGIYRKVGERGLFRRPFFLGCGGWPSAERKELKRVMTRRSLRKAASRDKDEMDSQEPQQCSAPISDSTTARTPAVAVDKENVENEKRDFCPPSSGIASTPAPVKRELTPRDPPGSTVTSTTNRSVSSLFSPPPSSAWRQSRPGSSDKKSPPSSFPENWEASSATRGQRPQELGREGQQDLSSSSYAAPYGMQQVR